MLRATLQLICIPPDSFPTEKTKSGNDAAGGATLVCGGGHGIGQRRVLQIMTLRFKAAALLSLLMASLTAIPCAHADGLDLSAYKGKVVYLDFWASWCTPCRLSFPWMNEIQQTYGARGLVVIGVNVDHDRALADEFLRANRGTFKIVYDPRRRRSPANTISRTCRPPS